MKRLALAAALLGTVAGLAVNAASAATISTGTGFVGVPVALNASDFTRIGDCGIGDSIVGDGCEVVIRSEPDAWDRFNPLDPANGKYAFTNDINKLIWIITHPVEFDRVQFQIIDAYDMGAEPGRAGGLPESWFRLYAGDAEWSIPVRVASGTVFLIDILLDDWVNQLVVTIDTRIGDGLAIANLHVNPIPLPAAGLLLLGGLGGLGALRWRARG